MFTPEGRSQLRSDLLQYAANDARIFAKYAELTLGCSKDQITILNNATKNDLLNALDILQAQIENQKGQAEIFIFLIPYLRNVYGYCFCKDLWFFTK